MYVSLCASKPKLCVLFSSTFETTIDPSTPAFSTICLIGASSDFRTILIPAWISAFLSVSVLTAFVHLNKATPPPGRTPSSTAARVAFNASSTLSFFSFTSISVAPPTLMTATPPESLASLSCSFSLS